jgi:ATP-binding cassette subfamily B protein
VLENGRIAEQGIHGELLKKNGIYHKMWKDYQSSVSWKVGEKNA